MPVNNITRIYTTSPAFSAILDSTLENYVRKDAFVAAVIEDEVFAFQPLDGRYTDPGLSKTTTAIGGGGGKMVKFNIKGVHMEVKGGQEIPDFWFLGI